MADLIQIQDLKKNFHVGTGRVLKAIDGVSFSIREGETFGLVGESGCGKTTTGRVLVRLYQPSGGKIVYKGKDTSTLSKDESKEFCRDVQMIFQDPYASLNPRMSVEDIVAEGLDIHMKLTRAARRAAVHELLELVGLNKEHAGRFPHEFSGGQRQRIGIARALASKPRFLICDEPISALDVSIQAQIVNLLMRIQKELGLTYLFIAHDLSMVKYISDRVGVMYLGSLVEVADSKDLYANPMHPYTRALLSAIPIPDPDLEATRQREKLQGEIPSPINAPPGCKFSKRCPHVMDVCTKVMPEMIELAPGHTCACHLYTKK
ncbi:MAG: ABC transporter ATP-binding protein [Spirochaetia bacterium]|nr:ABC transporter ATP-binding protein [Spirochaetia bacterium]